jgi:hypothetical protein
MSLRPPPLAEILARSHAPVPRGVVVIDGDEDDEFYWD